METGSVLQSPKGDSLGRMVNMSRRHPFLKVKLDPHAVWDHLNRHNLTQNDLARLAGLSLGYLSQLISGKRCPSPATRRRLQEVFGEVGFDQLFIVERDHET